MVGSKMIEDSREKTKLFSLLQKGSQPSQHLDFSQVPDQFHISDSLESPSNKSGLL